MLTHLGLSPVGIVIDPTEFLSRIVIGKDLFFSGHMGMPFFIGLIFWDHKLVRNISIFTSILMAICVILGHLHYSIDVFFAFFITYSILQIAKKIFKKDWDVFCQNDASD